MNVIPDSSAVPDSYYYEGLYYRMAKTFGGKLISADWQFGEQSANVSSAKASQCDVIIFGG